MHFRSVPLYVFLIVIISLSSIAACRRNKTSQRTNGNETKHDQDVTINAKPQDAIFIDFQQNWRQLISQSPEFTLPVVAKPPEQKEVWEPLVLAECVFSPDAGTQVPQVTLVWNEPAQVQVPTVPAAAKQAASAQTTQTADLARTRFDLSTNYQGFAKNEYSSTLATDKLKRFNLPSNSALVSQPEAVVQAGPSLFPKLMDFRTESIRDRDTNRDLVKKTLVLRDLTPGLTYTIRVLVRGDNQWSEEKEVVFLTPVCFKTF
ncbi:MAG TPA: hypothetical protein VKB46_13545 [Pyrinomonadaceae bacterium]|nr:hypothetical protein [Pyrinomonadaceae bacterium]